MPSSRYLFRLVPWELPTDETECSLSDGVLLQTPTAVQTDETPEKMRARAERNGYKNGTKFGSLTSQVKYDPRVQPFQKTPCTADSYTDKMKSKGVSGTSGTLAQEVVNGYAERHRGLLLPTPCCLEAYHPERVKQAKEMGLKNFRSRTDKDKDTHPAGILDCLDFHGMLPTPTAIEGVKWTNTWNPNSQMGKSLSAMAGSGMLPTPITQDYKKRDPNSQQQQLGELIFELANGTKSTKEAQKSQGVGVGMTSRLSPLFTEEMMGFPLMWAALPFLSESGAPKPSKPTATPSCPK